MIPSVGDLEKVEQTAEKAAATIGKLSPEAFFRILYLLFLVAGGCMTYWSLHLALTGAAAERDKDRALFSESLDKVERGLDKVLADSREMRESMWRLYSESKAKDQDRWEKVFDKLGELKK